MTVHEPAGRGAVTVVGGPLIGVCWQPGQRVPAPILGGTDRPVVDGRYGVRVQYGDDMHSRSPTHYPVTGPDLRKPYWQHVYHDITDDIATGRLTTGAAIGTLEQLADSYVLSSDKIQQALDGLRADYLITAIDGTWYIAGRATP